MIFLRRSGACPDYFGVEPGFPALAGQVVFWPHQRPELRFPLFVCWVVSLLNYACSHLVPIVSGWLGAIPK
jgi:hypothetical protein